MDEVKNEKAVTEEDIAKLVRLVELKFDLFDALDAVTDPPEKIKIDVLYLLDDIKAKVFNTVERLNGR